MTQTFRDILRNNRGLQSRLAEQLGITPGAITLWKGNVPVKHAWRVSQIIGVNPHDLCPKHFPPPERLQETANGDTLPQPQEGRNNGLRSTLSPDPVAATGSVIIPR